MYSDKGIVGKLPVGIQTVLALALTAIGVFTILNATAMSTDDSRWFLVFCLIGVMFLVNGIPSLLEGAMTMIYEKKE